MIKYEAIFKSDHDYNSTTVGIFDTYDDALLHGQREWAMMCDNDHKWYSRRCYYLEIHTLEWNDEDECYDIIDIVDQIDVDTL